MSNIVLPVDFSGVEPEKGDAKIAEFYNEQGLIPPKSFGDLSNADPAKRTPEWVRIKGIWDNAPFYRSVVTELRWAQGAEPKQFVFLSNMGGPGAVFVPLIGDSLVVLVKQYRPTLGLVTLEVPRGFHESWDSADAAVGNTKVYSLPAKFATALRELREEVTSGSVVSVCLMGQCPQNSGTDSTVVPFYLIRISPNSTLQGTEGGITTQVVPLAKAYSMIGTEITDLHSISAIALAMKTVNTQ